MQEQDAYLDAFMNGFEFVLLAIRGRLQLEDLRADDRERLEKFLDEYARIIEAYRKRTPANSGLVVEGRIPTELAPLASN